MTRLWTPKIAVTLLCHALYTFLDDCKEYWVTNYAFSHIIAIHIAIYFWVRRADNDMKIAPLKTNRQTCKARMWPHSKTLESESFYQKILETYNAKISNYCIAYIKFLNPGYIQSGLCSIPLSLYWRNLESEGSEGSLMMLWTS